MVIIALETKVHESIEFVVLIRYFKNSLGGVFFWPLMRGPLGGCIWVCLVEVWPYTLALLCCRARDHCTTQRLQPKGGTCQTAKHTIEDIDKQTSYNVFSPQSDPPSTSITFPGAACHSNLEWADLPCLYVGTVYFGCQDNKCSP